jgi:UDP-glucuronate 4-epimerase
MNNMRHALVTGGAGFIGSHLIDKLLAQNWQVTTIDNFDPFYDLAIKEQNIAQHISNQAFRLFRLDIRDYQSLQTVFDCRYDVVVHLAARAGVRPSIADPVSYQEVNVGGTQHLLELARQHGVEQFVFASSSSVYGVNPDVPWREDNRDLLPISPYAATKLAGEYLGHVYSHLFGLRFLALRFFTVYGPRQRPDLAIHKFARLMLQGKPIPVYGDGNTQRDYTYIDDIIHGVCAAMTYTDTPFEIINLGNFNTVSLNDLIHGLEEVLGVSAIRQLLPEQPGDVPRTWADITKAKRLLNFKPATGFSDGLQNFKAWLCSKEGDQSQNLIHSQIVGMVIDGERAEISGNRMQGRR